MMKYLIFSIFLIGCYHSPNRNYLDNVKWDFYKKNIDKYFDVNGEHVPYYKCDLNIKFDTLTSNSEALICYYGEFTSQKVSTLGIVAKENMDTPTVNAICYNQNYSINKYFLWDNATITDIIDSLEKKESERLVDLVKLNLTNELVRKLMKSSERN